MLVDDSGAGTGEHFIMLVERPFMLHLQMRISSVAPVFQLHQSVGVGAIGSAFQLQRAITGRTRCAGVSALCLRSLVGGRTLLAPVAEWQFGAPDAKQTYLCKQAVRRHRDAS
jgi:hypothetical protein